MKRKIIYIISITFFILIGSFWFVNQEAEACNQTTRCNYNLVQIICMTGCPQTVNCGYNPRTGRSGNCCQAKIYRCSPDGNGWETSKRCATACGGRTRSE